MTQLKYYSNIAICMEGISEMERYITMCSCILCPEHKLFEFFPICMHKYYIIFFLTQRYPPLYSNWYVFGLTCIYFPGQ